jgi:hypothetical protein
LKERQLADGNHTTARKSGPRFQNSSAKLHLTPSSFQLQSSDHKRGLLLLERTSTYNILPDREKRITEEGVAHSAVGIFKTDRLYVVLGIRIGFNADPDPAFTSMWNLIRIRILVRLCRH